MNVKEYKYTLFAVVFLCGITLMGFFTFQYVKADTGAAALAVMAPDTVSVVGRGDFSRYNVDWDDIMECFAELKEVDYTVSDTGDDEGAVRDKYENSYHIKEGQELWLVKKGDCLWSIAEEIYGDGLMYMEIYENNKDMIGDDPRLILEGMELKLP